MRSKNLPREVSTPPSRAGPAAQYAVGVVNYRSYPELKRCLRCLEQQKLSPAAVLVVDLDGDAEVSAEFRRDFPAIQWEERANLGYAAAANICLDLLARAVPESGFVLLLNSDVELESEFASVLIEEMEKYPAAVLGTGKLLRADGYTLDSTGVVLPWTRRPRDRGSERVDEGQYDRVEFVWGVSGAAMLVRVDSLGALQIEGEVFDEDFFMYHEDTDLAWRAQNLGMRALYVPAARATHQRGWKPSSRFEVPVALRRHSFKNHYLEIAKNESPGSFAANLPFFLFWEVMRLGHVLIRDREVLPAYAQVLRAWRPIWRKRRILRARLRSQSRDVSRGTTGGS